jgi:SsrA-binding protein
MFSHKMRTSYHIAWYILHVNLIEHKKARLEYDLLEEFEAGLELLGHEVKSLRAHHGKLEGAHIIVRDGEAYLVGASIPPYQPGNTPPEYDPERSRKLLLTQKELASLGAYEGQKGLTIVPISVYNKGKVLKLRIAVARGRKKYDKRAVLKERDTKREMQRTLKNK